LKNKRIGVLLGGISAEREVSLNSGKAILHALIEKGYQARAVDVGRDIAQKIIEEKIEVGFVALHGRYGEDGTIQGLLEILGIPYTGSGVTASAMGMNKLVSKRLFEHSHILIPSYRVVLAGDSNLGVSSLPMELPVVIKPNREGSSVGVTIVRKPQEIERALQEAFHFGEEILIERYIEGKEISVGILDDHPLGAIEIKPAKGTFYDYRVKYTEGLAEHIMPAPLRREKYEEALDLALRAHRALGCEGATRIDLRLDPEENYYVLEVNTLPGMTELSLLPEIAQWAGIPFVDFVEKILLGARLKG
jgi:D-alanine-D-alanine ligase